MPNRNGAARAAVHYLQRGPVTKVNGLSNELLRSPHNRTRAISNVNAGNGEGNIWL